MSKTSKQTNQQQVDPQLAGESASLVTALRGLLAGGPRPMDKGADIAAFTPTQKAAMRNTNKGLQAFGMQTAAPNEGMPKAMVDPATGVKGYSTGKAAQKRVNDLPQKYQTMIQKFYKGMGKEASPVSQKSPSGGKK